MDAPGGDPLSAARHRALRGLSGPATEPRSSAGRASRWADDAVSRPTLPLLWLDTLWVQVSGTLCNIACTHCFVSAGPNVQTHKLMTAGQVTRGARRAQGSVLQAPRVQGDDGDEIKQTTRGGIGATRK